MVNYILIFSALVGLSTYGGLFLTLIAFGILDDAHKTGLFHFIVYLFGCWFLGHLIARVAIKVAEGCLGGRRRYWHTS